MPDFQPILVRLSFLRGKELVPIFELGYESGKVTGFFVSRRDTSAQRIRQTVEAPVPGGIVDQRIDWAAILASNLEAGEHIEFSVFEVRVKASHELMHFKSYVIDGALLRTGSANWSPTGLKRQDNDVHYVVDTKLAALFETRFEAMWDRPTNRIATASAQ